MVPKAAKADIWRLAIVQHYGGIYADSDVRAVHPFREYVWPNASVVSGVGGQRDLHQWCLPTCGTLLPLSLTVQGSVCELKQDLH